MAKKEKKKSQSITIFQFLESLTYSKEDLTKHPDFQKLYNPFMINRWLGMNKETLYAATYGDRLLRMGVSKEIHFRFLISIIEKQKVWFQYEKVDKENNLKSISDYYDIGLDEALEYLPLLDVDQIEKISNSFGGKVKK